MARVQVVGLGRVGLPLAIAAARAGHRVRGVETDERVRRALECAEPPYEEPGLAEALRSVELTVGSKPVEADVHVIAVPTPLVPEGAADLSAVDAAAAALERVLRPGDLVVLESTCPPGTTQRCAARWRRACPEVHVACATERVSPGQALDELARLPRVVGGVDPASTEAARAFYATLAQSEIDATDATTAEVVKLVENAYRDVNIAFANEVDSLCNELGLEGREVIRLANKHPRVGILEPGPGVGGHCLPIDPWFLVHRRRAGALVRTARRINDARPDEMVERILAATAPSDRVVCLGLAYKPAVDDLRLAPAVAIVERLRATLPGRVRVVDPHVARRHPELEAEADAAEALRWADLVVALVAHPEFRRLDAGLLSGKRTLDLCGLWHRPGDID